MAVISARKKKTIFQKIGGAIGGAVSSVTNTVSSAVSRTFDSGRQSVKDKSETYNKIAGALGSSSRKDDSGTTYNATNSPVRGGGGGSRGGGGGTSPTASPSIQSLRSGVVQGEVGSTSVNLRKIQTQQDLRKQNLQTTYNPRTGMYDTYDPNARGTIKIESSRVPTYKEQSKIDVLESYGLTANLDNLKRDIAETKITSEKIGSSGKNLEDTGRTIEAYDKGIEDVLKGNLNDKGEFIGSESQYNLYTKLIDEKNREFSKYEKEVKNYNVLVQKKGVTDRDIKFSYFGGKDETLKASDFSSKNLGLQIGVQAGISAKNIYWNTVGKNFAKDYASTIGKIKVGNKPDVVYDLNTGVARLSTDKDRETFGTNILTQSQVEKGVSEVGKTGMYFIPYAGQTLYALETGSNIERNYGGNVGKFIKANPVEAGLITGGLFLGGAYAGVKFVRNKGVQSAVVKELSALEGTPLKSLTIIDEGSGRIVARGYRETPTGYQVVKMTGRIQKTEKGFKFLPDGKGTSRIVGVTSPTKTNIRAEFIKNELGQVEQLKASVVKRPTGDKYFFTSGQKYGVGVKGKGLRRGEVGNLRFFENVGIQTSVPTRNIFGMVSVPETSKGVNKALKDLKKQLKKDRELGSTLKEVKLPTGQADYIQINKVLGMKVSKAEVGTVIKIPKKAKAQKYVVKKPKIKTIEEQFGLKITRDPSVKSSPEFLKDMFKPQVLAKPKLKKYTRTEQSLKNEILPSLKGIAGEGIILAKKEIPKTSISGLPVGRSAYAGTNQYEQTITEISPNFVSVPTQNVLVNQNLDIKSGTKEVLKPTTKIFSSTKGKEKQIGFLKPAISEITKEATKESVRERTALKELLGLKSQQKQAQELKQLQRQQQRQVQKTKIKAPLIPVSSGWLQDLALKPKEEIFEIFRKVKGVFEKVGEEKTLFGASGKLKSTLLKDLRASGFISKGGKKISAKEYASGLFRISKQKDKPFLLVQRSEKGLKGGRLTTRGEKEEILSTRKKNKKEESKEENPFTKLKILNKKLSYRKGKPNKMSVTVRDFKAPSILNDPNRFFGDKTKKPRVNQSLISSDSFKSHDPFKFSNWFYE